jgi:hypothetical protein
MFFVNVFYFVLLDGTCVVRTDGQTNGRTCWPRRGSCCPDPWLSCRDALDGKMSTCKAEFLSAGRVGVPPVDAAVEALVGDMALPHEAVGDVAHSLRSAALLNRISCKI